MDAAVISPEPADGDADVDGEDEREEETELEGEEEMLVEGEADAEGEDEIDVDGEADAEGDDETLVEGDAECDGEDEIEEETEREAEGDSDASGEAEMDDDGEDEREDDGELLSICVTMSIARAPAEPFSPATSVTLSPTAYPVPAFGKLKVATESMAPSKISIVAASAPAQSAAPSKRTSLAGKAKQVVAAVIVFVRAIVFVCKLTIPSALRFSGLIPTLPRKGRGSLERLNRCQEPLP